MALTRTLTFSWTYNGAALSQTVTLSCESVQEFEATVPGSGNVVVNCEVDVSQLRYVAITCSGAITLTTNDDGTPDDTFTITADSPLVWYSASGLPNPFVSAVDVETFKATKGTAVDATLKCVFGYSDVTT